MMKESDFNRVFSRQLRYYLSINEMSQKDLAKRLGVGTTSVSNWCTGIKSPRMDKVDAMCEIFGCRRSDLMENQSAKEADVLTIDETSLLSDYNRLNKSGKAKARDYISDLLDNDKYTSEPLGSERERLA